MHAPFAAAFVSGMRFADGDGRIIEVTTRGIGHLKVPTGNLDASDPLTTAFDQPHRGLDRVAPVGVHPVELAIARMENGDERVASARVRFAPESRRAVTWEAARPKGEPPAPAGQKYGYGVDAGTGCFFDVAAVGDVDDETSEGWVDALTKSSTLTWSWHVADVGEANVVMFSSGWGDGFYSSYWGLDADGAVVELVTDFDVLVGPKKERVEIPFPLPRGRFDHPLFTKHGLSVTVPFFSWKSVVVTGSGAKISLSDGTPVEVTRSGDESRHSWKERPSDGTKLVVSVTTGWEPLEPLP